MPGSDIKIIIAGFPVNWQAHENANLNSSWTFNCKSGRGHCTIILKDKPLCTCPSWHFIYCRELSLSLTWQSHALFYRWTTRHSPQLGRQRSPLDICNTITFTNNTTANPVQWESALLYVFVPVANRHFCLFYYPCFQSFLFLVDEESKKPLRFYIYIYNLHIKSDISQVSHYIGKKKDK